MFAESTRRGRRPRDEFHVEQTAFLQRGGVQLPVWCLMGQFWDTFFDQNWPQQKAHTSSPEKRNRARKDVPESSAQALHDSTTYNTTDIGLWHL